MSLPVSDNLVAGRYELTGSLGVGGMAEVHRAWDTDLRRPVAVKLFRPSADADAARRFDVETRTLARLSHPGLVALYDAGLHDRRPFVVLQLVEGPTLRTRIGQGALPVAEVRRLGSRLAGALDYVHRQGVVHRDVKPSNILLDPSGAPHLADFGLARSVDATRFTRTGHVAGTAAYLAPEQVRGGDVGPAADVYALGLVLLECLTGRREYAGGDLDAALARLHRPPAVPDDLPADLVRLLSLMTSLAVRRRPTAGECAAALEVAEPRVLGDDLLPGGTSGGPADRPGGLPKKVFVVSAAGLVGAAGIAWTALSPTAPTTSAPVESSEQAPSPSTTTPPATAAASSAPAAADRSATSPGAGISTVTVPAGVPRQTSDTAVPPASASAAPVQVPVPVPQTPAPQTPAPQTSVRRQGPPVHQPPGKEDKPNPPDRTRKDNPRGP